MSTWRECRLSDIVTSANTGLDAIRRAPIIEKETGLKCLRIQDISQKKSFNKWGNTEVKTDDFRKYQLRQNDIIMARTCSTGICIFIKDDMNAVFNNGLVRIRANPSFAFPAFLFYLFLSREFIGHIDGISGGTSVQLNMQVGNLLSYEFALPPFNEQIAIASVLSSLDDKIDILQRQNKTLVGMAEALWRKMFVEDAVPNWKNGRLSDIAEINPLRSIKKGTSATYLDMSNMPTNGPFPKDWVKRDFTSGIKFKNGDTIIARITPCLENGKTAYVNFLDGDEVAWGSTEYIVMAPQAGYCPEWFYFLARSSDFRDFAIQNMTGTSGRQRVSGDSIAQYEIDIPPTNYFEKFRTFAEPIMEHIKKNSFQIRTLSCLRDTLLPKLMSGEVRVKM